MVKIVPFGILPKSFDDNESISDDESVSTAIMSGKLAVSINCVIWFFGISLQN